MHVNTAEIRANIQASAQLGLGVGVHMQITAALSLNVSIATPHRVQSGSVAARLRLPRGHFVETSVVGTCRALPERPAGLSTVTIADLHTLKFSIR